MRREAGALETAVRALAAMDEVTVQAMAEAGGLAQRAMRLDAKSDSEPLSRFDDVHEAPSRPLSDREYQRWLRS